MAEQGNNAAMRKALVDAKKSIDDIGASALDGDPEILMVSLTQVCARLSSRIEAALSESPRNCDVGTPEEQSRRFDAFCCVRHFPSEECCSDCPCHSADRCEFKWGQLPYEGKG